MIRKTVKIILLAVIMSVITQNAFAAHAGDGVKIFRIETESKADIFDDDGGMITVKNYIEISEDSGKTWGEPLSIIGKTLEEYRAMGIKDSDSKYFDTPSYSNIFCEKLSDSSFLVVYNNLKYSDGDGVFHKAAFVRKILA